ncbi:MAG: toll/interleukin-1 receptor domain-containing protein, partial [Ginsengibacter sp.]
MNIPGLSQDSKQNKRKNIFINYRVHDTAGETGRLVDRLKQYFYEDQIFMDIDKIEPGVDFTKAISKSLESCDIMLAIIGPHWLGKDSDKDSSRIKNPNDWVKLEISTALQRDIRVVPVLVDGAQLPASEELPAELQSLLLRQSYEISNKRWKYDTDQLITFLVKLGVLPKYQQPTQAIIKQKTWWQKNSWWVFVLLGIVITMGVLVNAADEKNNPVNDYPVNNLKNQETTPQKEPQRNEEFDNPPVNNTIPNVSGTWIENNNGIVFTYGITQNGNDLSLQLYQSGQYLGVLSGNIHGSNVEIYLNMNGVSTAGKGILSQDGMSISGTYTLQ